VARVRQNAYRHDRVCRLLSEVGVGALALCGAPLGESRLDSSDQ